MFRLPARRLTNAFLFLFLIASPASSFAQGAQTQTPGKWVQEREEREAKEQQLVLQRHIWFMKGRQAPAGETPAGARIKAFHQAGHFPNIVVGIKN